MPASLQTIVALGLVAVAAAWLIYSALRKRPQSGCGGDSCAAVSPEVKKLQARLKR